MDVSDEFGISIDYITLGLIYFNVSDSVNYINQIDWIYCYACSSVLPNNVYGSYLYLYGINDIGWKSTLYNGLYYVTLEMYSESSLIYAFHLKYPKFLDARIRCGNYRNGIRYNWTAYSGYINKDNEFSGWDYKSSDNTLDRADVEFNEIWNDGDMWSNGYYFIKIERASNDDTRSELIGVSVCCGIASTSLRLQIYILKLQNIQYI